MISAEQMSKVEGPSKSLIELQIILWGGYSCIQVPVLKTAGLSLDEFVMGRMLKYMGESKNE